MIIRARFRDPKNLAAILVASSVLTGCLSEEVETAVDDNQVQFSMSGSVGDGPIVNANMAVIASSGAIIAEFQSDSNAAYNITVSADDGSFPLKIEADGGTDLVTNTEPDFELSSAVFDGNSPTIANVNPFSTIAVYLAEQMSGGLTENNLSVAEQMVSDALNSGLSGLRNSGPIRTRIDETNISEIVRASETLAETIRRVSSLMQAAGRPISADATVRALAADLTDGVIDGIGGTNVDRRAAAVSTIVSAQILLESMSNQLWVNGADATNAMDVAISQVSDGTPSVSLEQLPTTAEAIRKARIGLAAAYSVDESSSLAQLHGVVSGLQPGQTAATVRVVVPANFRTMLQSAVSSIASADDATIDRVNAIARTSGDLDVQNLSPVISGSPATAATVGAAYVFTPTASDPDGDVLMFSASNVPAWASFDVTTGRLSGTPLGGDIGSYAGIVISTTDGEFTASLPAFSITVSSGNAAPAISGSPATSIAEGQSYSFTPTASDADGDTLTFSISNQPSWSNFSSTTGRLSGVPPQGSAGSYSGIVISVSDGAASASLSPFTVTVTATAVNSAPQISGNPPGSVNENESYSFTPTASDPDGDALTFSVSGLPGWATFNNSTGRISGTPSAGDVGTYSGISISVSDGSLSATLPSFSITVQAISLGSVTLNWTAPTENDDGSPLTDLAGYKVYWGTSSGNYSNSVTINNPSVTTYIVENLSPGTYEFVATSLNSSGVESIYSGSVTEVVP